MEEWTINTCYTLQGEIERLQEAADFIAGWFDDGVWIYDSPNYMPDLLLKTLDYFGLDRSEWMSKYPNRYEWMDNYVWEEGMDHIEVVTMGFLPEQTDVMQAFCECFGLSFLYETIYLKPHGT